MNTVIAAILLEMIQAWEGSDSYENVVDTLAADAGHLLTSQRARQVVSRALIDLGEAIDPAQKQPKPATT